MTSRLPNPIQQPLPDSPPPLTRAAFIQRLKLKHRQSHWTYDDDDIVNDDNDHYGDDETEHDPGLSPSSSKSTTPETQSPISPVDDDDDGDDNDGRDEPHGWILSAAGDEELKEWGQYLDETCANPNRRLSGGTAASSTGWSAIALSCGECLPIR
jgi:hypothetical protein